jgi:hypothetical protein
MQESGEETTGAGVLSTIIRWLSPSGKAISTRTDERRKNDNQEDKTASADRPAGGENDTISSIDDSQGRKCKKRKYLSSKNPGTEAQRAVWRQNYKDAKVRKRQKKEAENTRKEVMMNLTEAAAEQM